MLIYRFLTGKDDADFCYKITKALSEGWQLYGSPQLTKAENGFYCGQAVTKEVKEQPIIREKKLVDY